MITFLRTISTRRLLAGIFGAVAGCLAVTAIAIAAVGNGPVPPPASLASAIHTALQGKPVDSVSASITFTNNLFSGSSIETSDPLITGASGRLWATAGHLRLELQSDNGDSQIVVDGRSFWVYDASSNTVYRGVLPQQSSTGDAGTSSSATVPTLAQIQRRLDRLSNHFNLSAATPTDVGGEPAYSVSVTPKSSAGLIGQASLSFDADHAVPLDFAVYPRGDTTPALELQATSVNYGPVPLSDFQAAPPTGAQVVNVSLPARQSAPSGSAGGNAHNVQVIGKGLGSVIVAKHPADASKSGSGPAGPLPLQSVTIDGATGQQLPTSLGTVLEFTRDGVSYLLAGSVTPATLDSVAQGL